MPIRSALVTGVSFGQPFTSGGSWSRSHRTLIYHRKFCTTQLAPPKRAFNTLNFSTAEKFTKCRSKSSELHENSWQRIHCKNFSARCSWQRNSSQEFHGTKFMVRSKMFMNFMGQRIRLEVHEQLHKRPIVRTIHRIY